MTSEAPDATQRAEAIGKKLCELRGLDPLERVPYADPNGNAVARYAFRWVIAAQEVRQFEQIQKAIAMVDASRANLQPACGEIE